jgi:hypothetical protein
LSSGIKAVICLSFLAHAKPKSDWRKITTGESGAIA